MRVLISAYACEPNKGSEPGIGWNWVLALSQLVDEMWVVTRSNNKATIERQLAGSASPTNLHFVYFDLPSPVLWLKKKLKPGGVHVYYILWQRFVRRLVSELVRDKNIDIYHHLTFSADWLPSFPPRELPRLTKITGPLAGYRTSRELSSFVPTRYAFIDTLKQASRKCFIWLRKSDLGRYDVILANNQEFEKEYRRLGNTKRIECISTQITSLDTNAVCRHQRNTKEFLNILTAGRLLYWKGSTVAVDVFSRLKNRGIKFKADIVGSGPRGFSSYLRRKCREAGLEGQVSFHGFMPRRAFLNLMSEADVFLYPSFYGTADSIMIEALELRTPIVCFPSNAAIELLTDDYPYMSKSFSIDELAESVLKADRYAPEFVEARERILAFHSLDGKFQRLYEIYRDSLKCRGR